MADLHDSTEHYLATIYEIEEEGIDVRRARIAERLDISPPSVTEHIQRMEKLGLVTVDEKNLVSLTVVGREKATSVVRRHRLAERLLVDIIGLDWALAHDEADRWEHVISDVVEEKLIELLGDPQTCPHGNPIPNTDGTLSKELQSTQEKLVPLSDLEKTDLAVIRRIGERIEVDNKSLSFLSNKGLTPGVSITISDSNDEELIVLNDGIEISIPNEISKSMFVEPV